jgi:hypothetical protein
MGQINVAGGKILSQIYLKEVDLDEGLRMMGTAIREIITQIPAPKS